MKKALILGCSHAAGSELGPDSFSRANSYPALVASLLGYSVVNLSVPGGSNDAMFRLFLDNMHSCDIVIAAWSGFNRSEIFYEDAWIGFAPGSVVPLNTKNYFQQWCVYQTHDKQGRLNKIKNVVALNALSTVPVINCESFWPVGDYQWPESINWPLANEENFWDWSNANNYKRSQHGHFELAAHQHYAKYILENLKL